MYKNPEEINLMNSYKIEDFEIGKKLGSGRFGRAYLVRKKRDEFICVLKIICKSMIRKNNFEMQIRQEIEIQSHLSHKNILDFYGFFWDERRIYLILEYAPGGDIYGELKRTVIYLILSYFI
jgi:serine/threonine protein kinase